MKLKFLPFCIALIINSSILVAAQSEYSIRPCGSTLKSQKYVGDRLRFSLPKNVIVKKGGDIDYSDYYVGFGKKKVRVWLSGMFGPTATSGKVSEEWIALSTDVTRRTWKFGDLEGVDAKGKLANGNYWRYVGQYGEFIKYYDVSTEAVGYFDSIIDGGCYQEWK